MCLRINGVSKHVGWLMAAALLTFSSGAYAATVTWLPTGGTNDWFVETNWSSGTWPTNGDDVVIANSSIGVLLTNSTVQLGSLFISNTATLIFSNWATVLNATTVTVEKSAILTHAVNSDTNGADGWTPDARVWINCSNLTVAASGSINVNLKGYGAPTSAGPGYGPGGGLNFTNMSASGYTNFGQGAGYGGYGAGGGNGTTGTDKSPYGALTYGTLAAPEDPGSGGGSSSAGGGYSGVGSWGGGAIRVDAGGLVTVNGTLTANGGSVSTNWRAGAGSGGGIYITCNTLAGSTNGIIRAQGGAGYGANYVGAGGGGRIAVLYNNSAQAALAKPAIQFDTSSGYSGNSRWADYGTVYFTNSTLLSNVITRFNGQLRGFSAWQVDRLTVTNSLLRFAEEGFSLTVTQALVVEANAKLDVGGSTYVYIMTNIGYAPIYNYQTLPTPCNTGLFSSVNVGGDLRVTNGGYLFLYNAPTGMATETYGNLLTVSGQLWIATNSWIYPLSHPTNGGSSYMVLGSFRADQGGGINGNGYGFGIQRAASRGPGGGLSLNSTNCGGGGHGGAGGGWTNAGGITYDSSNAPIEPGSSGASWVNGAAGTGGGVIRLQVGNTAQINGSLTVNGGTPYDTSGGSGGSIYLRCRTLSGSIPGSFQAKGSAAASGATYHGGGGGRIAVWRMYHTFTGTNITVAGGAAGGAQGKAGSDGTIVWGQIPPPGTIITGK